MRWNLEIPFFHHRPAPKSSNFQWEWNGQTSTGSHRSKKHGILSPKPSNPSESRKRPRSDVTTLGSKPCTNVFHCCFRWKFSMLKPLCHHWLDPKIAFSAPGFHENEWKVAVFWKRLWNRFGKSTRSLQIRHDQWLEELGRGWSRNHFWKVQQI